MTRPLSLRELRRRLALLPDPVLDGLTRPGLDPTVVAERVERVLEQRPPVPVERGPAGLVLTGSRPARRRG